MEALPVTLQWHMASPTVLALPPAIRAVAVSYAFDVRMSVKDIAERLNVEQESISELLAFVVLNAESTNLLDLLQVLQRLPEEAEDASDEHTHGHIKQEVIDLDSDEADDGAADQEQEKQTPMSPASSLPPAIANQESTATERRSSNQDQNGSELEAQEQSAELLKSLSPQPQDHESTEEITLIEHREPAKQFTLTIHLVEWTDSPKSAYRKQKERLKVTPVGRAKLRHCHSS